MTTSQWKKPYSTLFSGIKVLFVNQFSKNLRQFFFRPLECKMVTLSYFLSVFQNSQILRKAVSKRLCMDSTCTQIKILSHICFYIKYNGNILSNQ